VIEAIDGFLECNTYTIGFTVIASGTDFIIVKINDEPFNIKNSPDLR